MHAGHNFARVGVVAVSINYRLGIPGFTADDGAPPNRGMHDQPPALRWVHSDDDPQVCVVGAGEPSTRTLSRSEELAVLGDSMKAG